MKLAEALSIRADLQKKISQLKVRMKDSAKKKCCQKPSQAQAAQTTNTNTTKQSFFSGHYTLLTDRLVG